MSAPSREDELKAMLLDLRKEQFNLRFQRASGQLEATGRIKVVRRDIARVKTIMGERQRAAAPPTNRRLEETSGDAEARPHGPGGQRQDGQDRHGACRASRDAPALQEVHPALQEVRGARRGERLQGGRRGADRGVPAHLQAQGWLVVQRNGAAHDGRAAAGCRAGRGSRRHDPRRDQPRRRRQLRRAAGAVHQGARRLAAEDRRASATSSSSPSRRRSRAPR